MWITDEDGILINLDHYAQIRRIGEVIMAFSETGHITSEKSSKVLTLFIHNDECKVEQVMQQIRLNLQHCTRHLDLRKLKQCLESDAITIGEGQP